MCNLNDFFNKDFLLERINNCDGLSEIEDCDNYIEAYDEYEDMFLRFHYNINYEELFDFGSLNVDKEKFFNVLKNSVEQILFLMPKKIYFISTLEELNELLDTEEYCCQSMDFENHLGINWIFDSTIVINISSCRIVSEEMANKMGENFETFFNEAIWTTLIHELRHMVCNLGLVIPEDLIPISEGSEERVEEYGNNCFWNSIIYDDYICFH